jgi:hypothetical protein
MITKIELKKIKVANGLIIDIKGYHIHFCSSSDSFIEKSEILVRVFCYSRDHRSL